MNKRIIPILTIDKNYDLVKSIKYKNRNYIGCPINAVKIFNEKMCDELCIVNIDNVDIDLSKLSDIVSNCFMPVSYSGSIKNLDTVINLFKIGFEKIILNESFFSNTDSFDFLKTICDIYGVQSIGLKIDFKKSLFGKYKTLKTKRDIFTIIELLSRIEVGEIIISNVTDDGTFSGYDLSLFNHFQNENTPVVIHGGASCDKDLLSMVNLGYDVAASSIFVYYGKHRAVLINYKNGYEINENM